MYLWWKLGSCLIRLIYNRQMRWEFGIVVLAPLRITTSHMKMCILSLRSPSDSSFLVIRILGGSWWWLTCLDGCMVKGQVTGSPMAGLILTQQLQRTGKSCPSARLRSPNSRADHGEVQVPLQPVSVSLPTTPTPLGTTGPTYTPSPASKVLASSWHSGRAWTTTSISHQRSMDTIVI